MNFRSRLSLRISIFAATAVLTSLAFSQQEVVIPSSNGGHNSFGLIASGENFFGILPPLELSPNKVLVAVWSNSGKRLAFVDQSLEISPNSSSADLESTIANPMSVSLQKLSVWDAKSKKIATVFTCRDINSEINDVQWLAKERFLLVSTRQAVPPSVLGGNYSYIDEQLTVNVETGVVVVLTENNEGDRFAVANPNASNGTSGDKNVRIDYISSISPTEELLIKQSQIIDPKTGQVEELKGVRNEESNMIDPDGRLVKKLPQIPSTKYGTFYNWNENGTYVYALSRNSVTNKIEYYREDQNGRLDLLAVPPKVYESKTAIPKLFALIQKQKTIKLSKNSEQVREVWLHSIATSVVPDYLVEVTKGVGSLSPDEKTILVISPNGTYLRRIVPGSDQLKIAYLAAKKAEAINNAKQAALGLIMYSGDNNDILPSGQGWQANLMPYVKNQDVLDSFTYTPPSQLSLTAIESPADTQIGYAEGPGGRAVAFSDGHVKWFPNP